MRDIDADRTSVHVDGKLVGSEEIQGLSRGIMPGNPCSLIPCPWARGALAEPYKRGGVSIRIERVDPCEELLPGDATLDGADYTVWADNFGAGGGAGPAGACGLGWELACLLGALRARTRRVRLRRGPAR